METVPFSPGETPGYFGNLIPRKNANELIDFRIPLEQFFPLAFGQASGDDHLAQPPLLFQPQHLLDNIARLARGRRR